MKRYFLVMAILMIATIVLSGCDEPVATSYINVYVDRSVADPETGPYCVGVGTEERPYDSKQCAFCWFIDSSYSHMRVYQEQEGKWVYINTYTNSSLSKAYVDPYGESDATGDGTLTAPFETRAQAGDNAVIFILTGNVWICEGLNK